MNHSWLLHRIFLFFMESPLTLMPMMKEIVCGTYNWLMLLAYNGLQFPDTIFHLAFYLDLNKYRAFTLINQLISWLRYYPAIGILQTVKSCWCWNSTLYEFDMHWFIDFKSRFGGWLYINALLHLK